ncbi:phosphopyruvate hydratase, partial [Candidatus Dojkabacteria bacterium]|nr:phosphopyruvate hydratase [Candidatus Dojkabacteria bacterium]
MSKIASVYAREILASGANPTLEAEVVLESGARGIASVPYGASAGIHEATVLLDEDKSRYNGKGMLKAIGHINGEISEALVGMDADDQRAIDNRMIELDGTPNKARFGGNAILGVSLAVAHAMAEEKGMPLYRYIREVYNLGITEYRLPNPMMVVIEGGKHADNSTDFQEYIVSAFGKDTAKENVRMGIEIYQTL